MTIRKVERRGETRLIVDITWKTFEDAVGCFRKGKAITSLKPTTRKGTTRSSTRGSFLGSASARDRLARFRGCFGTRR